MAPDKPSRRRLTQAEWDAELKRAKAADLDKFWPRDQDAMRTRSGRRRSWWQRGWKR